MAMSMSGMLNTIRALIQKYPELGNRIYIQRDRGQLRVDLTSINAVLSHTLDRPYESFLREVQNLCNDSGYKFSISENSVFLYQADKW